MAYDVATAQKAAQQVGAQPPEGIQPGTPEYNQWVVDWFTNGVNAGDARLLRIADPNASIAEGGGEKDLITDWRNAAPSSEWLGKRMPTAPELRRYYKETGKSEDLDRFGDRVVSDWLKRGGFDYRTGTFAGGVEKPTETGGLLAPNVGPGGGGGGFGGGAGGGGGFGGGPGGGGGQPGAGTFGGAPGFQFTAPTFEEAMADPGYQFALREGTNALTNSALARGVGGTSGTLKDLINYGQQAATQQYGNVYGRQYQLAKDVFAPQYGSWETKFGADLQKYLQREGNIYGLINTPPPTYPTYGG